jgi:uncharacterized protein YrrD
MQVRFGDPIIGTGGQRIGDVNGLIVDAGTKRARAILVDAGLLDRAQHMVAFSAIERSDQSGLHLDATGAKTDAESPVLDSEEVAFAQRVEPETTFIPAAGVGGPVMASEPSIPGEYPDESSFIENAPLDPPPVEIESNLGENEVRLDKGTDAISNDGHKIGEILGFELGDMGLVDQITVSEGFILKHQASFPIAEIGEFGTNAVHLRLSKDEAEKR